MIFSHHVDSIDFTNDQIVIGLSSLEGNVWNGSIRCVDRNLDQEKVSYDVHSGVAVVRNINVDHKNILYGGLDTGEILVINSSQTSFFQAHDSIVSNIISYDNNHIISCGWDGVIHIWDTNNLSDFFSLYSITSAHYGIISDIHLSATTATNPLLASIGYDGFIRTWDLRQSNKQSSHIINIHTSGSSILWSSHNAYQLYAGGDTGHILSYDIRKLSSPEDSTCELGSFPIHNGRIRKMKYHPTKLNMLISCSDDCTINTSAISPDNNLELLKRYHVHDDYVSDFCILTSNHTNDTTSLQAEDILISGSFDKSIKRTIM